MDKSRTNEIVNRESKNCLKAIEKNDNIIQKTKNQYIKRSYSTKLEYQIDKTEKSYTQKRLSNRKCASLNFINYTLGKSQSTSNFPEQRNALPVIKIPNTKKKQGILKCTQFTRPYFHDLIITSKLKDDPLSQSKNTAFKFSIDIDNLLTKKRKPKLQLNKIRSFDMSKEASSQDQQFYYYDYELPSRYKNILSKVLFNINFKQKRQKIDLSPTIRQGFLEELLNNITRKICIYNHYNQFIKEEDVAGFINHEVNTYFKKNRCQLHKMGHMEDINDSELEQKEKKQNSSLLYDYKKINHHKQLIMNQLIKKELNKSDDLNYNEIIHKKVKNEFEYKNKLSHVYLMLNSDNDDLIIYNKKLFTTTPKFSSGYKYFFNSKELIDKDVLLLQKNEKKSNDDLDMTMRSFYILQPKGFNYNSTQEKRNNKHSSFNYDQRAIEGDFKIKSMRVNRKKNDMELKQHSHLNTIKRNTTPLRYSTMGKTQYDNGNNNSYYHYTLEESLELKKQMELEEKEKHKERFDQKKLGLEKGRIMRQEEEYLRYVEMKKQEEVLEIENEEKSNKKERKFSNFYVVNNKKLLLSVLRPKIIIEEPPKNTFRLNENPKMEQKKKEVLLKKEDIVLQNNNLILEKQKRSRHMLYKKYKKKRFLFPNKDEESHSKNKRNVYLLKAKKDINYFLVNNKKM